MEKNWLIRTKSNHILGPITKDKVLELYQNGSIKPDDEVCSGNGYWFFIREDELVQKYLINGELQGFNPISEAKDVLTSSSSRMTAAPTDDITMVGGINLSLLKTPSHAPEPPPVQEPAKTTQTPKEPATSETKKKNNVTVKPKAKVTGGTQASPLKKQDWLKYLSLLGFIFLFFLIYFRKTIIQHLFKGEITSISIELMSSAHAQVDTSEKKKSSLKPL